MLKIVNPETGKVVMQEHDDGRLELVDETFRESAAGTAGEDGRVPDKEELQRMIAQIEAEQAGSDTE